MFYNPPVVTFPASYLGNYFFGELTGWVNRLDPANGNAVYAFARVGGTTYDVHVGPDGAVYVLTNGVVYRFQAQ